MIQTRGYDRVLLDLVMPRMSGHRLYELIKESDPALAKRIIFMTALAARPEVKDVLDATGLPVLSKPFDLDELRRVVLGTQQPTHDKR